MTEPAIPDELVELAVQTWVRELQLDANAWNYERIVAPAMRKVVAAVVARLGALETTKLATCSRCQQPAKQRVALISRRDSRTLTEEPLCEVHVQAELRLGAENLSMVNVELRPL